MKGADLLIVLGFGEDSSNIGSNQQLRSPPNMREYELRTHSSEKKGKKKNTEKKKKLHYQYWGHIY